MGDDVHQLANDKALMLINHQSTSDVPLIMAALDGRTRNLMWIMDRMFMKTNFGLVSWFHKDFFISSVSLGVELFFFFPVRYPQLFYRRGRTGAISH